MTILITIGPTQEPLDSMRLISNRSTGELGTLLATSLADLGHTVIVLRGIGATAPSTPLERDSIRVLPFTTTEDLRRQLEKLGAEEKIDAIFHSAAVSDFYLPGAGAGKIPTSGGALTLTVEPTPKLLPLMRGWFPAARITGWKFEASGDRDAAVAMGRAQIAACHTDACVVNGPSYSEGFGVLTKAGELANFLDKSELCAHLAARLTE
jgi:phosphopantothenoylcysteine decarboxylase/phosphopantothenate--cysteine ligase